LPYDTDSSLKFLFAVRSSSSSDAVTPPSNESRAKILQTDRRPVRYYNGLLGILENLLSIMARYKVAEEVVLIVYGI
jgi:hypothetical protein